MIHIVVDESDPIEESPPPFPYRDVKIRRDVGIRDCYDLLKEIGRGKFGLVYRCKDRESGLILAAKVVTTKRKDEKRCVEREIDIMRQLQHPRVIQLFDAIEDVKEFEMCLILEMVEGGELFDRVIQDEFILTEKACAVFIRQICEALDYIHSKSILHLDMKPENVMCVSKTGNRVKIIDFGLARFYDPAKKLQVLFGTPEFVAPEIVNFDEIDYRTDMWSVGVMAYVLLSGLSPFMGDTDVETMANVTIAKYDFEDTCFDEISDDAKDFIEGLLKKFKRERMSASEALLHQWLQPFNPKNETSPDSDNEIENELVLSDDMDPPDLRKDTGTDDSSMSSATPDSLISSIDSPQLPAYMNTKRPSLDASKDNLREFVSRYSDNPYMFDSPRGIISHLQPDGQSSENSSCENKLNDGHTEGSVNNKINLVQQIRRYSQQLNVEFETSNKKQCSSDSSPNACRKSSWSDSSLRNDSSPKSK